MRNECHPIRCREAVTPRRCCLYEHAVPFQRVNTSGALLLAHRPHRVAFRGSTNPRRYRSACHALGGVEVLAEGETDRKQSACGRSGKVKSRDLQAASRGGEAADRVAFQTSGMRTAVENVHVHKKLINCETQNLS